MKTSSILLISSAALLFSIGLLMVFNTTAAEIIDRSLDTSTHAALFKQISYGVLGVIIGLIIYLVGIEKIISKAPIFFIITTFLLILVFIPKVGVSINGARRWINFFGFSFQPSEIAKLFIPLTYIYWYLNLKKKPDLLAFIKILSILLMPTCLILFEPDNGTTFILFLSLVVLFVLTRIRLLYWGLPLLVLTVFGSIAAYNMPHVPDRIRIYLHPELDLKGKGHQPHQAKIAAGSGKLFGRGLGESLQKLNYLPEARNDYIAAIYAEEMGFVGVIVLIGLYITVALSGFVITLQSKNLSLFLLGSVVTFLITIQAFLNLGIVSGLLPSKGMTLPFFSQGGSSLILNIVFLFILLDIGRSTKKSYA